MNMLKKMIDSIDEVRGGSIAEDLMKIAEDEDRSRTEKKIDMRMRIDELFEEIQDDLQESYEQKRWDSKGEYK